MEDNSGLTENAPHQQESFGSGAELQICSVKQKRHGFRKRGKSAAFLYRNYGC
jgi:hypothetical protein